MYRLTNPVRHYTWGATETIPEFLGMAADGRPYAEMWIGAHPAAPSAATAVNFDILTRSTSGDTTVSLRDLIESNPESILGAECLARYGPALPFLTKILAADKPLSIQVHPSLDRARVGYEGETEAGTPEMERNYADPNHKPELLIALQPTLALAGFRSPDESVVDLEMLESAGAARVLKSLARMNPGGTPRSEADRVRAGFLACLELSDGEVTELIEEIGELDPLSHGSGSVALAGVLSEHHKDGGVIASILMNVVELDPGEALFVDPGTVHAYVQGFGVEVMASSDNVLRAGLTQKRVDRVEFFQTANFFPSVPDVVHGAARWSGLETELHYPTPTDDFAVRVLEIGGEDGGRGARANGPRVLVCLDGTVEVKTAFDAAALRRGESLLVGHFEGPIFFTGRGRVVMVTVGTTGR